jgi:hypothetical protein
MPANTGNSCGTSPISRPSWYARAKACPVSSAPRPTRAGLPGYRACTKRCNRPELRFGGNPRDVWPHGFGSVGVDGALYAVVNPPQGIRTIHLPRLSAWQEPNIGGRVLFQDAGFGPDLEDDSIRLGPGQLALARFGRYADSAYDLRIQSDFRIPRSIKPLEARFHYQLRFRAQVRRRLQRGRGSLECPNLSVTIGRVRVPFQQRNQVPRICWLTMFGGAVE